MSPGDDSSSVVNQLAGRPHTLIDKSPYLNKGRPVGHLFVCTNTEPQVKSLSNCPVGNQQHVYDQVSYYLRDENSILDYLIHMFAYFKRLISIMQICG